MEGRRKAAAKEKLESSHADSIAFPWRIAWEHGSQTRSIISALFWSVTLHPHHHTSPHLTSLPAQEYMLAEGPGSREREKEGKRTRTRKEVEENKTGLKRKVEGRNQGRGEMQKSGNRRKQKRGQEKHTER